MGSADKEIEVDRELIVAALSGGATPKEAMALETWRRSDPANEALFRRYERLWGLLGSLDADAVIASARTASAESLERVAPQLRVNQVPGGRTARSWTGRRRGRLAMVIVATLLTAGVVWLALEKLRGPSRFAEEVSTPADGFATIPLTDGSVIRLGPDSRIRIYRNDPGIEAYVEGLAFFTIRSGIPGGFRVRTEMGQVDVLGTRFSVDVGAERLDVLVFQGNVELSSESGRVLLEPSEWGQIIDDRPPSAQPVQDIYGELAWVGDFVAFESTPIHEVAREFDSRFGIPVVSIDPLIGERTVTGWFRGRPPEEILADLCLAVNGRCRPSGDTIYIEDVSGPLR